LYAFNRGARRPDYARMRGDSRAALLGRPDEVELRGRCSVWLPERKGKMRATDEEQAGAEDGRADVLTTEGVAGPINKDTDYRRPRGESGAALLGRPETDGSEDGNSVKSEGVNPSGTAHT